MYFLPSAFPPSISHCDTSMEFMSLASKRFLWLWVINLHNPQACRKAVRHVYICHRVASLNTSSSLSTDSVGICGQYKKNSHIKRSCCNSNCGWIVDLVSGEETWYLYFISSHGWCGCDEGRDRTLATYSAWCDYCMACVYGLCVLCCTDCVLVL